MPLVAMLATEPSALMAAVLTEANAIRICTATHQGRPAVDKDRLALAIATEAQAVEFLDGANPGGVRNGAIDLVSSDANLSEPYASGEHRGRGA